MVRLHKLPSAGIHRHLHLLGHPGAADGTPGIPAPWRSVNPARAPAAGRHTAGSQSDVRPHILRGDSTVKLPSCRKCGRIRRLNNPLAAALRPAASTPGRRHMADCAPPQAGRLPPQTILLHIARRGRGHRSVLPPPRRHHSPHPLTEKPVLLPFCAPGNLHPAGGAGCRSPRDRSLRIA